jgi:hypothetical protein
MNLTRLAESTEYAAKRADLRLAELELMRHEERVAELRRALPPGPAVEDYVFEEGPRSLAAGDGGISSTSRPKAGGTGTPASSTEALTPELSIGPRARRHTRARIAITSWYVPKHHDAQGPRAHCHAGRD